MKIIGLRKFIIAVMTLVITTILVILKIISGDNYATILQAAIPAFMAANLVEYISEMVKKKLKND